MPLSLKRDKQYVKFCLYGFLKNLRFFDVFLLLFFLENDLSFSQIGMLYAAREIITNIIEIPSGIVADSYGRKSALLTAFFIYILSFITFYLSSNFVLLLAAMALMGIGDAFRSGTHKGMIMDYLKINQWDEFKIQYYGETRSWSQKGAAISALLAGVLVYYSGGYRAIYLMAIVPYLLNFINIYSYPDGLNHSIKERAKSNFSFKNVMKEILDTLKKGRVIQVINSSALHSAYLKSIKDYIQPLIVNLAILLPFGLAADSKSESGMVVGITYFFIFLLTSYASKNSARILSFNLHNIEQKTLFAGLCIGIGCGIFYHFNIWWLSLIFFVFIYLVENLRKPILTGYLADNVPNEILTSVLSTQSFYKTMATATIAILIGAFADYLGVGVALLLVSLSLILLTIFIDMGLKKNNSRS